MGLADSGALKGRVALITGAATGIGRASALLFARAGARVALVDVREAELARTEADVRAAGGESTSLAFRSFKKTALISASAKWAAAESLRFWIPS